MGTHTRKLDKFCKCGTQKIEVHMKNPFIDDFMEECPACEEGHAYSWLESCARSAAREEEDCDREYEPYNHEEE